MPIQTPDDAEFQAWKAARKAVPTGDDAEFTAWKAKRSPKKSGLGGAIGSLAQGMTFGWADEALGGIEGLNEKIHGRSFGEGFKRGSGKVRDLNREFRSENPALSTGLEIAGAVAPAIASAPLGIAKAGLGLAKRIGLTAAEGGVAGGVYGAGSSDGGTTNKLRGAAVGAGVGALTGGALQGAGAVVRGARAALSPATKKTSQRQSFALLQKSLERDQVTPAALAARANEFAGKPAVLADLAGENTMGLARGAQATPSIAKEELAKVLQTRAQGQLGRVAGELESWLGLSRQNVHDVAQTLIARTKANAEPLYAAARPLPINSPATQQEIVSLMELPEFRSAMKRGARIAAVERNPMQGNTPLTVGDLDYMKRGLDAVIESRAGGKAAISRTEARALRTRLNELLTMVDAEHPQYAKARSQFAGDKEMEEALETGRSFLKADARVTAKEIAAMSPGEQELYRIGALDAVRLAMDKAGDNADLVKRIFGSPEKRAQIRELFSNKSGFDAFEKKMALESRMTRTKDRLLGGSPTARISSELADMAGQNIGELAGAVGYGAMGYWPAALMRGASLVKRHATGNVGNVADDLSRTMLTQPGTSQFQELMQMLADSQVKASQAATRGAVGRRAVAGNTGGRTQ